MSVIVPTPRRALPVIAAAITGAFVGFAGAGCGGAAPAPVNPPKAATLVVEVQTGPEMNERRSCYVVVRAVDEGTFLKESYSAVAAKVFANDPTVIEAEVIFPARKKVLTIQLPASVAPASVAPASVAPTGNFIAIYVLFTRPQGEWKQLVRGPWEKTQQLSLQLDGSAMPPLTRP
jgi:hypothetical protein